MFTITNLQWPQGHNQTLPRRHDDTNLFIYVITFVSSCLRGSFKTLHKSG